jgi:hypothetical protein
VIVMAGFLFSAALNAQDTVSASLTLAHPLGTAKTDKAVVNGNIAVINADIKSLAGISVAGVVSNVRETMTGCQASGFVNIAQGDVKGLQTVGLVNVAKHDVTGLQYACLLNITGGTLRGAQYGYINIAGDVKGFQFGLINIARQMDGIPFGLINIARNGKVSAIAYVSNFSGANVGAKFIVNNFHSIISVGGYDMTHEIDTAFSVSAFWGYHLPLDPLYLEFDLGSSVMSQITNEDNKHPDSRRLQCLRVTAGWNIASWIGVFAGIGPGVETKGNSWKSPKFVPEYHAGITVF